MGEKQMKGQQIRKILLSGLLAVTGLITAGCSRAAINYQIAEAIGTVGEYDSVELISNCSNFFREMAGFCNSSCIIRDWFERIYGNRSSDKR